VQKTFHILGFGIVLLKRKCAKKTRRGAMKIRVFLVLVVGLLFSCGFVYHGEKASNVDYERLASLYSVEKFKSSSYGVSGSGDDRYPQLFRASSGKRVLLFLSGSYMFDARLAEMDEHGGFLLSAPIETVSSVYTPFYVWEQSVGGYHLLLGVRESSLVVLDQAFRVTNTTGVSLPLATPPFPVWDREKGQWEFWLLALESGKNLSRYKVSSLSSASLEGICSVELSTFHGLGVIEAGETNFAFLSVKPLGAAQGAFTVCELVMVQLKGGEKTVLTTNVYSMLTNVGEVFVDVLDGYKVYFSMKTAQTGEYDLYRLCFLTFDRMLSDSMRKKLP